MCAARGKPPRLRRPPVVVYKSEEKHPVPREFRPARDTPAGRFPLLKVFEGLERTVPFRKYPGDDAEILKIARKTWAQVTDGPGWMYVAPRKTPPEILSRGFRMVESDEDEIVVARAHLTNSSRMDL
ncbi:MAG: hypothetical protein L3J96_05455, partial [Thermoplasmata archaeon]|nr:hypothetical protein [Thermoplasmata archaeon]